MQWHTNCRLPHMLGSAPTGTGDIPRKVVPCCGGGFITVVVEMVICIEKEVDKDARGHVVHLLLLFLLLLSPSHFLFSPSFLSSTARNALPVQPVRNAMRKTRDECVYAGEAQRGVQRANQRVQRVLCALYVCGVARKRWQCARWRKANGSALYAAVRRRSCACGNGVQVCARVRVIHVTRCATRCPGTTPSKISRQMPNACSQASVRAQR